MPKSKTFKNKKKMIILLVVCLVTLTALTAVPAVFAMQGKSVWIAEVFATTFAPNPAVEEDPEDPFEGWTPISIPERPGYFSRPQEMRAVYLKAGVDFLIDENESAGDTYALIDAAIDLAVSSTMNTIIIDPMMSDGSVIHASSTFHETPTFLNLIPYIVEEGQSRGLYVYSIFYVLPENMTGQVDAEGQIDTDLINRVRESAQIFAASYELNGVLLDNYFLMDKQDRYEGYLLNGAGIGYENYMYNLSDALFSSVVELFNLHAPGMQVGLISEAVWANSDDVEEGSATSSNFTMLQTGHCDVKGYVEKGLVDFIAVRAYDHLDSATVPYKTVVAWWSQLAGDNDLPLYMIHAAHKAGTQETGWSQYDQLPKQVIAARENDGFSGSIFNSLTWLRSDPVESASILIRYYEGSVRPSTILSELALTRPTQRTFETYEPYIAFTGASDPNVEVTLNGEPIDIDENGYFSITVEMEPGLNTYVFYNKGRTITYNITRMIQVIELETYSPTGTMEVDGGTSITITAVAYNDSTVYAMIGGTRVNLTADEEQDDSTKTESAYWRYSGTYRVPDATDKDQDLGNITLYGTWGIFQESYTMARVKVNKKASLGDGRPIIVTADIAETFPSNVVNNLSEHTYYPLARGARDITVGNEIVYRDGSNTYRFYNLQSGVRVYASDIAVSDVEPGGNQITGYEVMANTNYTFVTVKMTQQVSYSAKYNQNTFTVKFNYTSSVPGNMALNQNPLFNNASWDGTTLTLSLNRDKVFLGVRSWYDGDGNLVLRFNNTPRGVNANNLSGVKIVVDPGHGGSDPGAIGFLAAYPEKTVNYYMSQAITAELQNRGANVVMLNTYGNNVTLAQRVAQSRSEAPHLFISVHANSATSSSGHGTEVFYFTPFSYDFANRASSRIASAMSTTNRGAKYGRYYVTRVHEFPAVLCEIGFLTNQTEYYKLINEDYQQAVARGVADAVGGYFEVMQNGSSATGTQTYGS